MESKEPIDFQETVIVEADTESLVRRFVEEAIKLRASDIFLVSEADGMRILIRHMGSLHPLHQVGAVEGRRCMNYIKTAAGMDLMEKRRPADGRWVFRNREGERRDLRINTIPTLHGEDFSLRLISRSEHIDHIDNLGLARPQHREVMSMLRTPGGLILVTGPSGAGKTTSLYAFLRHLNDGRRKINTIEDPIEADIAGVRQSQVDPAIELDFPDLLRSVLRQAPDVILIGEIRDRVTAQTAIRAANSGHLVLATMHAPVAASAVQALMNYDVHPHFLASCLLGVVTQRLIRTLCVNCRNSVDISAAPQMFDDVRSWLEGNEGSEIFASVGCELCLNTGFSDRTGVFEVLTVTPQIRRLVADDATAKEIYDQAQKAGMMDFRRAGLLKVAQGVTSMEELMRVVAAKDLGLEID